MQPSLARLPRSHAPSPAVLRQSKNRAGKDWFQAESDGSSPPEIPEPDRGFFEIREGIRKYPGALQEHFLGLSNPVASPRGNIPTGQSPSPNGSSLPPQRRRARHRAGPQWL